MLEKILFVDDEPQALDGYHRLLQPEFRIETAASGAEALAKLACSGPYAVVVCDMRMPEMDGLQLLQRIKLKFPDAVRVMLTGNMDQETAVKAVNDGNVFRFLNKPCDEHTLKQTLQTCLVMYRLDAYEGSLREKARGLAVHHPEPGKENSDDGSFAEVEKRVRAILTQEAMTILPAVGGGTYIGKMIWEGPDHVVQRVSATRAVAHPKKLLKETPAIGEVVRIEYVGGTATIKRISF
jgi:CheY-like chemotaxis protein